MAADFQQAASDLREIAKRFGSILALAEHLAALPSPTHIQANIDRLNREQATLMDGIKKRAIADAELAIESKRVSAESETAATRRKAQDDAAAIVAKARLDAAQIIADAKRDAEDLARKFDAAQQHVAAALR